MAPSLFGLCGLIWLLVKASDFPHRWPSLSHCWPPSILLEPNCLLEQPWEVILGQKEGAVSMPCELDGVLGSSSQVRKAELCLLPGWNHIGWPWVQAAMEAASGFVHGDWKDAIAYEEKTVLRKTSFKLSATFNFIHPGGHGFASKHPTHRLLWNTFLSWKYGSVLTHFSSHFCLPWLSLSCESLPLIDH